MDKKEQLSIIYKHIGETLNISNTETSTIIDSYKAVGQYLGNLEEELDINIYPQGSLALGTIIKPLKSDNDGEYDIDMVCLLKNGSHLSSKEIKMTIGNRLKESERYEPMLESEGKRCWTLQYNDFHMDILPSVPMNDELIDTHIRLTHTDDYSGYTSSYSNPKGYLEWFQDEMKETIASSRQFYAEKNEVEIEEVPLYKLRTPLQVSIQLLKRHRDIMYQNTKESEHKPISIIITTLAAHAYEEKGLNLYDTLLNILDNMEIYIKNDENGEYVIENPTNPHENFADKWKNEPIKKDVFLKWLKAAKKDIILNPMIEAEGLPQLKKYLSKTFGENVISKSFESYGEDQRIKRGNEKLGVNKTGRITEKEEEMASKMANHTFYGEDSIR